MKAKIFSNQLIRHGRYLIELDCAFPIQRASPGQFVHVRIEDSCDPFLRRPLSIHDVASIRGRSRIKIVYEAVGKGTGLLARMKKGMILDLLGPLGKGFDVSRGVRADDVVLSAGGMGVAPLFFLAKKLVCSQSKSAGKKVHVFIGARSKDGILRDEEFRKLGCKVSLATDDGTRGIKGRVTDLLGAFLVSRDIKRKTMIYACGPKPMLLAVSELAAFKDVDAEVSLEEFMGCGLGACLGCVIRTTSGYQRICHDGPVFNAKDVVWGE